MEHDKHTARQAYTRTNGFYVRDVIFKMLQISIEVYWRWIGMQA